MLTPTPFLSNSISWINLGRDRFHKTLVDGGVSCARFFLMQSIKIAFVRNTERKKSTFLLMLCIICSESLCECKKQRIKTEQLNALSF